jgi:hypothetical protein
VDLRFARPAQNGFNVRKQPGGIVMMRRQIETYLFEI